ncbi:MAG: hypothetical protein AAF362_17140 [Pseudomonadota bacterium]
MTKYISVPLGISVSLFLMYFIVTSGKNGQDGYIAFSLDVFNLCTIIGLFILLYKNENTDAAAFGESVRANISTLIVALLINLVISATNIGDRVRPLLGDITGGATGHKDVQKTT